MEAVGSFLKEHAFVIVLGVTAVILVQYLFGRRANLNLAKRIGAMLEETFQPEDKVYTWIGGLTGFRADFELSEGGTLEATLLMRPRHSLLYLPISLLLFGKDRLFVAVEGLRLGSGEAHVIVESPRRISRGWLPDYSRFPRADTVHTRDRSWTLLAEDDRALALARRAAVRLGSPVLYHLAILPKKPRIYMAVDPRAPSVGETLRELVGLLEEAEPPSVPAAINDSRGHDPRDGDERPPA